MEVVWELIPLKVRLWQGNPRTVARTRVKGGHDALYTSQSGCFYRPKVRDGGDAHRTRLPHKLQWGEVGESEALALAERMALPEYDHEYSLLNTGERQLSDLISQVESQRQQLDKERQEAEFIRSELQRQQAVWERKNRMWEERKAKLEEKLKQDTRAELKSIEHRANKLLKQIREGGSLKDARRKATALKGLREELTPANVRPDPISDDVVLNVGDKYMSFYSMPQGDSIDVGK